MTKREEIIQTLLDRYVELVDPTTGPLGLVGSGDRVIQMPATYTPSVRELERLLTVMRVERPKQYRHVRFRYIERTQALKDVSVKRKGKHGKTVTVVERRLVDQYPGWVRGHIVEKGVEWLAAEWSLSHEPFLPEELRVAA